MSASPCYAQVRSPPTSRAARAIGRITWAGRRCARPTRRSWRERLATTGIDPEAGRRAGGRRDPHQDLLRLRQRRAGRCDQGAPPPHRGGARDPVDDVVLAISLEVETVRAMSCAGGAPLQWRVMLFWTARLQRPLKIMSAPDARGPKEHEKTRHWSGAPPAKETPQESL